MSVAPVPPLPVLRRAVDVLDGGMLLLFAARRGLAGAIGVRKRALGRPLRDPLRERRVHARARLRAALLGVPSDSAGRLVELLINEACRRQGAAVFNHPEDPMMSDAAASNANAWLGWLV